MTEQLHISLQAHAHALMQMVGFAIESGGDMETLRGMAYQDKDWRNAALWFERASRPIMTVRGGHIHSLPLLSPSYCDKLTARAQELACYRVNECEGGPYQIPEIVISQADPELYKELQPVVGMLVAFAGLIWQRIPGEISTIQFAKYAPNEVPNGNWHHDTDSDYSAVVSLNPGGFTGGGTEVMDGVNSYKFIPPLSKGHCLFFDGTKIMHRGVGITKGERDLLVFWLADQK